MELLGAKRGGSWQNSARSLGMSGVERQLASLFVQAVVDRAFKLKQTRHITSSWFFPASWSSGYT